MEEKVISVFSHQGLKIEQTLITQASDILFILLPGRGYTVKFPLLFYAQKIALDMSADCLSINYSFQCGGSPYHQDDFWHHASYVQAAINKTLKQADYRQIVFIGKSLGSIFTAALIENYDANHRTHCILLTPLPEYTHRIIDRRQLVVYGTADRLISEQVRQDYKVKDNISTFVVKRGDHSLEVGNLKNCLSILTAVMTAMYDYLIVECK